MYILPVTYIRHTCIAALKMSILIYERPQDDITEEDMKENKGSRSKKEDKKNSVVADIPLGLSSALARNVEAMRIFSQLPDDKRKQIIDGARSVSSKQEMKNYVSTHLS